MAANTVSYAVQPPASTPTRAPRPTLALVAFDTLSLCRNCGGDYYPEDIPAALRDCGQYGTCADCRAEVAADVAAWAVAL